MIVDSLSNSSQYYSVHKDFKRIFEFLSELSVDTATGKVVMDEERIWANISVVSETDTEELVFEAHRDFLDIHLILSGEEKFGYANINRLNTTQSYDNVDDYELLTGDVNLINLKQGDFCIVFPQDAHIPVAEKVSGEPLHRVIVKVKKD